MVKNFNFKSTLKDIQTRLVSNSVRETSNLELLKSEEAIKGVIESYSDRFRAIGGMLTDVANFVVNSRSIVKKEQFNDFFESIYMDLTSLYSDLALVDEVLKLNLDRNRSFFLVVKKRIRDLWNRLRLTRLEIYDDNPSDESFFESFNSNINSLRLNNVEIDKKTGYLHLERDFIRIYNEKHHLKNITSTTYPEPNDEGGVFRTTNELNTFEDNYKNGPKDLMENGLWKEEYICNEVPDMIVDIGDASKSIYRNYKGLLSMIDIDYKYPVEINRLDYDVFGDYPVTLDSILYKSTSSGSWKEALFEADYLDEENKDYIARDSGFDIITAYNIKRITAKHLRLVVNQQNYKFQDSQTRNESTINEKINKDLSERRYELVKFGSNFEDMLGTPIEDENTSLYSQIISIIESTTNIELMLEEINNLLNPSSRVLTYDFTRTIKFDSGAWSIEPKIEHYSNLVGIFDSKPYQIRDRALISTSLTTEQSTPDSTTCNWYINIGGKDIPIVENNSTIRKEPVNILNMSNTRFNDWTPGTFILLDFPMDLERENKLALSENGNDFVDLYDQNVVYLNSRLLFLNKLIDPFRSKFTIKYPVAINQSVILWSLISRSNVELNNSIQLSILSADQKLLQRFISQSTYTVNGETNLISQDFTVGPAMCFRDEARDWLGLSFSFGLFISDEIKSDISYSDRYSQVIKHGPSKTFSTKSDLDSFLIGNTDGYADLGTDSLLANVAPLTTLRTI